MIYEAYGTIHRLAKKILRGEQPSSYRMVDFTENIHVNLNKDVFFNEDQYIPGEYVLEKKKAYPVENIVSLNEFDGLEDSFRSKKGKHTFGVSDQNATETWEQFIKNSEIPSAYRNGGLSFAGYILDCESWCLPSWIWTNAKAIAVLCAQGNITKAVEMADALIELQQECGGWIVRNDYSSRGMIPMLAPNDSAYIANNGCISVYLATKDEKYLDAAEKCANWITKTARPDGLVWLGMNMQTKEWITNHNIVDIGFTAGLFVSLFEITGKNEYRNFLSRFIATYCSLFRKADGCFATGIDKNDQQLGGAFGRGQAWALEGLIPTYTILKEDTLKDIIDKMIKNIIVAQDSSGAWPYNFKRKLLGLDCKATSVIAVDLLQWYPYSNYKKEIITAVKKAIKWCEEHTVSDHTQAKGGIFSYCMEGAIVHHLYTSTAFVYSSAYAIEMLKLFEEIGDKE